MTKNVEQVDINWPNPENRRISWWLENTIIRSIARVFNRMISPMRQILSFSITDFIEDFEGEMVDFVRPLANTVLGMDNIPVWLRRPIEKALARESQAGITILVVLGIVIVGVVKLGAVEPTGLMLKHQFNRILRPTLFDPGTLTELWKRGIISSEEHTHFMSFNGLSGEAITAMRQLAIPLYDDATLTQLYFRKNVGLPFVREQLTKRGYKADQIAHWFDVRNLIPSPSDLISIAVREGFNDAVANRFGYDEDFPTVAANWAEKQGLSKDFFKAQWRAHWSLPGLVQVREMYHRGIINNEQLQVYLKAADIPVFWRNALTKWMDEIVTRVDARRMYEVGVWNEERVYEHYRQLGYNEDDARDMTIWTSLEYIAENRELTKNDILGMYKDGILNEDEATIYLESLDYKDTAISLLLAQQQLKRDEEYERTIISNVRKLYVNGQYDRQDVHQELGKIGVPSEVLLQSLNVWDLEKKLAIKTPSITQLRDMVLGDVISLSQFREEMSNKKYGDTYINWYIKLWELE